MTLYIIEGEGVKLQVEDELDWHILEMVAVDIDGGVGGLLDGLMDEEPMWEEFVVPELREHFTSQQRTVIEAVRKAKAEATVATEGERGVGEIMILKEEVDTWYGALNQARLCLEEKYEFHQEDDEDASQWKSDKQRALIRSHGYQLIQQELLKLW